LGDASYAIYLTHGFVVPAIGLVVIAWHGSGLLAETMAMLACLAASSVVGTVVYRIVERPIMHALKRRPLVPS
jgi:exopolysaccharide production protein ExoZ